MRIAFVVGAFPEISTTFILDQVTGLLDRGHEVEVFARIPENMPFQHAVVDEYQLVDRTHYWRTGWATPRDVLARTTRLVVRQPGPTLQAAARSLNLRKNLEVALTWRIWAYASKLMEQRAYDVIVAHFGPNAVAAQRVREVTASAWPLVSVFHGYDLSRVVRERGATYYKQVFASGELMLPVSDYFRERLIDIGCPADRISVHRMGVDTRSFEFAERRLVEGERVRMVSICRLAEKKGLEFGLRAVAQVRKQLRQFEWHIAGDGPLRPQLERLIDALQLRDHVVLHGAAPRAEVQRLLRSGHLFLAPSVTAADGDQEGVPVAIMEAMACGFPVVSTYHSGIPELVRDGETGSLVREWDVPALTQRLCDLASHPDRWPSMGRAARQRIEKDYDIHRLNDLLSDRLTEVARRSLRGHSRAKD